MKQKLSDIKTSYLWWPFIVTLITIALDQWSKIATINHALLKYGSAERMITGEDFWRSGYLYLTYALNKGAAFSIFSGHTLALSMVSLIAAIYFIWDFPALTEKYNFRRFTWSLLIGGVLGNWIDRLFRGEVIDMLGVDIPLGGGEIYRFPVFNIADSAICVGVFLYFVHVAFFSPKKVADDKKEEKDESESDNFSNKKEAQA